MFWLKQGSIVAIVSILMLTSSMESRHRTQRVGTGMWGGDHIRIEVEADSATIEYDCANGKINGPLMLNGQRRFTWQGVHIRERGGPVRRDETPDSHPATYTGWIKGDTMTLTVKLADSDESLGPFILKRGSPGRVYRCK